MITKTVKIQVGTDFDVDSAAMLVQIANQFESNVHLQDEKHKFNAKSIMGMTTLGMGKCSKLTIVADGKDEEEALAKMEEYLKNL